MANEPIKYSFSRIENFHNCPRCYYYTYIEGIRGGESVFTFLGTICHEIIQDIIQGKETNSGGVIRFRQGLDEVEMLDLPWISEKSKQNYIECIEHCIENYIPYTDINNVKIEDYFEVNISGVILKGYIDYWGLKNDESIYIEDFKTSSKFSTKDIIKKQRQLLLYAYALKDKYPDKEISMGFDMLKYARKNSKLVERNKLNFLDEFDKGIIEVKYDNDLIHDLQKYILDTVNQINTINKNDILEWTMSYNPTKDFFCRNLCSFKEKCINHKLI